MLLVGYMSLGRASEAVLNRMTCSLARSHVTWISLAVIGLEVVWVHSEMAAPNDVLILRVHTPMHT